jgi:hypothetical protein
MGRFFAVVLLLITTPLSHAELTQEEVQNILAQRIEGIKYLSNTGLLQSAAKAQNASGQTQEQIAKIDGEWKAGTSPMIEELQHTRASKYLKHRIDQMSNTYNEAFVTDAQGANVAMYPATSDYWQGDEDSFTQAYAKGKGAVYIGKISVDASTNTSAVKISVPMIDDGVVIGVLVMGVKVSAIEAQQLRASH